MASFDRLARVYQYLEHAAFGRALQRARTAHIQHVRDCTDILILGDGDGRFLSAVLPVAANARVHCVDDSAAMLMLAAARVGEADRARVTFERADARRFDPGPRAFDAVVTMFFLDCFTEADVRHMVARLTPRLRPGAVWLFADFAIPPRGLARLHARLIVGSLYAFFRWRTGIEARALPPSERLLDEAGLRCVATSEWRGGLLRSAVYAQRP